MCGPPGAGPASAEFDELVDHNLRFRIRQFEMVTISADAPDDEATVKDFLTKKHASMKNYIIPADKKDAYFDALDPATVWKGELPYTLIVNEKGEVVYREHGAFELPQDAPRHRARAQSHQAVGRRCAPSNPNACRRTTAAN